VDVFSPFDTAMLETIVGDAYDKVVAAEQ